MKFIHTADWHIGESWKILPHDYLTRQARMIDAIYYIAKKTNTKTVVIAGDLFHKKNPGRECMNMVLKKVLKYDRYFNTIIMEGNHDSVDNSTTNIHYLKLLYDKKRLKNTVVVELENKIVPIEDTAFIVMPRFDENILEKMAKEACRDYKKVVAVLHTTTIGVVSDTNWVAKEGWDMASLPHIDYYAFGHIHKYQKLNLSNAYQSGSPIQHKWSDKLPKGVLLVDTDLLDNNGPEFISMRKLIKPLYTIKDGEKVPNFGHIRLLTTKNILGFKDLPDNVVCTERDLSNIIISGYDGKLDPTKGLNKYLAEEGLSVDEQNKGIKIVEDIVQSLL